MTDVPRVLRWVSLGVVVAGVVMGFLGALRTGTSWDEPFHVMRLRNYLDHGLFSLDWSSSPSDPESNTVVYGPVAMLLLHGLGVLSGVEHANTVSTSPAAYEVRHVGVFLIGMAGTAAAAAITRILLGSWRWGLVTAATLLALPMWTGHLMFNIKDVPVATGYTVTTLALIAMVAPVHGNRLLRVTGLAAGVVLMVGTRPAMFSAVLAGVAILAVGVLATGRFGNGRTALAEAASGVVVAALALLAIYPKVFSDPFNLLQSAEQSAHFRGGSEAAVAYVPFFVAAQVPLLLQGFFVVGLVAVIGFARSSWRTDPEQTTRYTLVLAQLLALPLVAVLKQSDLYNGLRQLLFASPAWAIIATLGLARAVRWARERGRTRILGGIAAAALVLPVLDQVSLFPYQYTYYNAALDATNVHVPSDYWRVSTRELIGSLPRNGQIVCSPTRVGDTAYRFAQDTSVDCRTDELGPLASRWSAEGLSTNELLPHDAFYVIVDRGHPTPGNCTRLASVDRTRHLRTLSMTYAARCTLPAPTLGSAPVVFTRAADSDMAPDLWGYAPEGWVSRGTTSAITAPGASAALAFRVPADCTADGCTLTAHADAPLDLVADLDGTSVALTRTDAGFTVALPAGTGTAWITLHRTSGAPLGLRVHELHLAPTNKE
ncbi:hypothetical protein EFL95_06225 [Nocardioides marmorisolisilvae]|uniref:Glycosyltransferase RgtA/B/C/D-like domain-containing protein n=1 Tax=Nocardioides marmorisolisilvae TaxID=1542737 RepID=A0A3N0DSR1_9ACTN|nr:hypothetical protein EFL95_06225 [Nocardioides marmorisolisilvae]